MTKLWILSDLHLEAVNFPDAFAPRRPEFDVLVAAGDIWQGDTLRALQTVARLANGKPSVFVMGNHEYWNREYHNTLETAKRQAIELGVSLLDNSSVELAGVRFVGGTLWADGKLSGFHSYPQRQTGEMISVLKNGVIGPITVGDEVEWHDEARASLMQMLAIPYTAGPTVVVTHHAPHPNCLPASLGRAWLAGILASDLTRLIEATGPNLWIHGHTHSQTDFNMSSGTRVICNPAGVRFENLGFDESFTARL